MEKDLSCFTFVSRHSMNKKVDEFLEMLSSMDDPRKAVFRVFEVLDKAMCEGNFEFCNEVMKKCPELNRKILLAILSITYPAKKFLPDRLAFFERVEGMYQEENIVERYQ